MRRFLRGFAVLLTLLPGLAMAQSAPGWMPVGGSVSLSVSTTSANVALPGLTVTPSPTNVKVCNTSVAPVYIALGGTGVIAYTSTSGANLAGSYQLGNSCQVYALSPNTATNLAAITSTGTTTLIVEVGSGSLLASVTGAGTNVVSAVSTVELDCDNSGTKCGAAGTTLTAITGLSITLASGKTYVIHGVLYTSAGASGGPKIALAAGDANFSVTSFALGATPLGAAGLGSNTTTLGTGIGVTAADNIVPFDATVVVNVGGALIVQGAQNATNATQTKYLVNSYISAVQQN